MPKGVGDVVLVKYGCERASAADIRSAGSNFRRRSKRSRAVSAWYFQCLRLRCMELKCVTFWGCFRNDLLHGHLRITRELLRCYIRLQRCQSDILIDVKMWGVLYRIFEDLLELCITGSANNSHDVQQLVLVISPTEKRSSSNHLCENTSARPHIDRSAVCPRTKEDVRRTIPQGDHLALRNVLVEGQKTEVAPTSLEKVFTGTPKARAKPKSPSFSSPFLLISKFWGFRSRCRTWFSWQNAVPLSS